MKIYLVILFVGLMSLRSACAMQDMDEVAVAKRIEVLIADPSILPKDIIQEAEHFIMLSKQNDWSVNLLAAITLKVEILMLLENITEAEQLVDKYLPIALQHGHDEYIVRLELARLSIADAKGFSKEIVDEQQRLINKAEIVSSSLHKGSIYLAVGQSQYVIDNLAGALDNFKKAYEVFESMGEKMLLSDVQNSIAALYVDIGDVEAAIEFLNEAIVIKKSIEDELSVSILLYNLGEAYKTIKQYEQSINSLEESIEISARLEDEIGIMWAKVTLADIYFEQKNGAKAKTLYESAAEMFAQTGDQRMQFQALLGHAKSEMVLGDIESAQALIEQAKLLSTKINSQPITAALTETIAMLHGASGNYSKAYEIQKVYTRQRIDIYDEERKQDIQKFKTQFDVELKENKNRILMKENELNNLKLEKQREEKVISMLVIGLGAMVMIVIVTVLYIQIQNRNRFKDMALKDYLTNTPNRRAILNYAKERFNEAKHTEMALSIGIIDLDHFKKINDTYGHETGDEVLKTFADTCRDTFRKQDRFGRYGGEEWLLVLSDTNESDIQQIFERLHAQLNEKHIPGFPDGQKISFSMGVAQYNRAHDKSLQSLINRADANLYKAKNAGRHQFVM